MTKYEGGGGVVGGEGGSINRTYHNIPEKMTQTKEMRLRCQRKKAKNTLLNVCHMHINLNHKSHTL